MVMTSLSLNDVETAKKLQAWAGQLMDARDVDTAKPDTVDGLRWDLERMIGQRDEAVTELNALRVQLDEMARQPAITP
jgi:hypothetical protein